MSARKIGLLILILGVGASLETAWQVKSHVDIGPEGCRVLGGRFYGPSWSFTEEARPPASSGARVEVTNAFGEVRVTAGGAGEVKVGLRKVVFLPTEERAREFAGRVRLRADVDGDRVRIATNRDEMGRDDRVGLETHLDVRVPPGTEVLVRNEHGRVDVEDVKSADVTASYEGVTVERVAGAVVVKSRHGGVTLSQIGGDLTVDASYGDLDAEGVTGKAKVESRHGRVSVKRTGGLRLQHAYGDVEIRDVTGDLDVKAEHSGLDVRDVSGNAIVQTSYNGVHIASVAGDVRVKVEHGELKASAIKGALVAEASYNGVELDEVGGPAEVTVTHGGIQVRGLEKGGRFKSSGDGVSLEGFRGPVDVESERAGVELTPGGPITERVSVKASHGGIRLRVPAGSRFDLEAEARHGEVRAEVPGLTVTRSDQRRVSGTLAGGGNPVRLSADDDVDVEPRTENARGES